MFDREEQAFMKAVGLETDDLEWLVQDAPPVADAVTDRVLNQARLKVALAPLKDPAARPRPRRLWLAAAAAALLLIGGATVALSPAVQAALKGLVQLIPGFGVVAVAPDDLVLAEPVTVPDGPRRLTVTGLHATQAETVVHFRYEGVVAKQLNMRQEQTYLYLNLPDGQRLQSRSFGATSTSSSGNLLVQAIFPPLPPETRSAILEVPALYAVTEPVTTDLRLTPATAGNLGSARQVTGQDRKGSILLAVSYLATDEDRIRIVVETSSNDPTVEAVAAELMQVAGSTDSVLALTDNLGNTYPLIWDETMTSIQDGRTRAIRDGGWSIVGGGPQNPNLRSSSHFTAVFAGPLRPEARTIRLTLREAEVLMRGSATLTVPASRLPYGQTVDLQERLQVGARQVTIGDVTWWKDGTTTLTVTPRSAREGAPRSLRVSVNGTYAELQSTEGYLQWKALARKAPIREQVEIKVEGLNYNVPGPWTVEFKLP